MFVLGCGPVPALARALRASKDGGQPQAMRSAVLSSYPPSQWWANPAEVHRCMENGTASGPLIST